MVTVTEKRGYLQREDRRIARRVCFIVAGKDFSPAKRKAITGLGGTRVQQGEERS